MSSSQPACLRPVAGTLYTAGVLAILAVYTGWGAFQGGRLDSISHPQRVRLYAVTLVFEWFLFGLVALGVRLGGVKLAEVAGERWSSMRMVVRDIGLATAFWLVSGSVLAIFASALRVTRLDRDMGSLFPEGPLEFGLWIVLSASAGICEEMVFRGYLQRQFIAWTRSVPAGLILSAIVFGAGHAYQGWRRAALIVVYGAMFGTLAEWRRNLRPGMIAHAWQDTVSGIASA